MKNILRKSMSPFKHILFVVLFSPSTLFGQIKEIKNVPSPEVANLGMFGSIPVGHYTGTSDISIPLYELSFGGIKVPIQAVYHTANVKPHIPPTSLGIGWALSAGGYITRTVKTVQDEKETFTSRAGFYFNYSKLNDIDNSLNKSEALKNHTYLEGKGWYELAADEFVFSFLGYSGTFYIDKGGQWKVISNQNIKVEFNENDGFITIDDLKKRFPLQYYGNISINNRFFNKFVLITPDGVRYEFGGGNATEYSIPYYSQINKDIVASCWRLSKITTLDKQEIIFDYANDSFMCDLHYAPQIVYSYVDNKGMGVQINSGRSGYTGFLTMPVRLIRISSPDESIELSYDRDVNYGDFFLQNTQCLYWEDNPDGPYDTNFRYGYGTLEQQINRRRFMLFTGVQPAYSENDTRKNIAKKITHDYLTSIQIKKSDIKTFNIVFDWKIIKKRRLLAAIKFREDLPSAEPAFVAPNPTNSPSTPALADDRDLPISNIPSPLNATIPNNSKDSSTPRRRIFDDKGNELSYKDDIGQMEDTVDADKSVISPPGSLIDKRIIPMEDSVETITDDSNTLDNAAKADNMNESFPPGNIYNAPQYIYEYKFTYYHEDKTDLLWPMRNPHTYTDSWGYYSLYGSNPYDRGEWSFSSSYMKEHFSTRGASLEATQSFVLKEIIYPTGGKSLFEYELNDYSKQVDVKQQRINNAFGKAGGLRTCGIKNYDLNGDLLYSKKYFYKENLNSNMSSGISKGKPCYYDRIYFDSNKKNYYDFYSFSPVTPFPLNFNTPDVGYSSVIEDTYDKDEQLIKRIRYRYTNYDTDINNQAHMDIPAFASYNTFDTFESAPFSSLSFERGKLVSEEILDMQNNIIGKTEYSYIRTKGEPFTTIEQNTHLKPDFNRFCYAFMYKTYTNRYLVGVKKTEKRLVNGILSDVTKYSYNDYGMLRSEEFTSNMGQKKVYTYDYTYDKGPLYTWMVDKNIFLPVSSNIHYGNASHGKVTRYSCSVIGAPYVSEEFTYQSHHSGFTESETDMLFKVEKADVYGNPIVKIEKGINYVLVWTHLGQRLIAVITNATYDEVKNALGKAPEDFSILKYTRDTYIKLNALRNKLSKAHITTYEYDNLLSLSSVTDPNGLVYTYSYDSFGRLISKSRIIGEDIQLLNEYKYIYKTQNN